MANNTMKTTIQVRRDTTANWLLNKDVVPAAGEPCLDLDKGTIKYGDGVTTYENLKESGASASHYEGVRQEGETDNDVIARVLGDLGAEVRKDDVFVVKALIDTEHYSYTAYIYNGSAWAAMDGNYSAENVYFPKDMTFTYAFGKYSLSSGKVTIPAEGKNLSGLLMDAYAEDQNPSVTQPSVSATCSQMKAYEVGTKVTPSYSASFEDGNYEYGPNPTGATVSAWSVTDGTATKNTASGSFAELTVSDGTSYSITATATYGDGSVPQTALGADYAAGQIKGGSKSASAKNGGTTKITGYRNSFYGTTTDKSVATDSSVIRGLAGKSNKALANGNTFNVSIPVGALRVLVAYPATLRDVTSIQDVNGMSAEIKSGFALSTVKVEGAGGYNAIDYKVYTMDFANANDTANTFKVTI